MTGHHFAIFDTAIGRCGIAWGEHGINAVQLPMSSEDKTRARIRQRYEVAIPRPRDIVKARMNPAFAPLLERLWQDLSAEVDNVRRAA